MGTEGREGSQGGSRKPLGSRPGQKHSRPNPVPPLWEQQTTVSRLVGLSARKPSSFLHLGSSPSRTLIAAPG